MSWRSQSDADGTKAGAQLYDASGGQGVLPQAGTVSTDGNTGAKYAPQVVQLNAGTALAGSVKVVDSAGTNQLGVDAQHAGAVSDGGTGYVSVTASSAAAVKAAAGRLCRAIVLTTVTSAVSVFDNTNAASGSALLTIPTTAAVGTIYNVQVPATNGLYVGGGAGSPGLLVTYN